MRIHCALALALSVTGSASAQVFDDLLLPPPDSNAFVQAWTDADLCGEWAVIGESIRDRATLFRWNVASSRWDLHLELDPGSATSSFGAGVSIGSSLLVVGDPFGPLGNVYAWYLDPSSGQWSPTPPFTTPAGAGARVGEAVLVDGLTAWVSAVWKDVSSLTKAGAVYAYRFDPGTWTWSFQDELTSPMPIEGAHFGWSLAKRGSLLLVGAPGEFTSPRGQIHVFRRTANVWVATQTLDDPIAGSGGYFGWTVRVDGDLAVTHGSGSVWVLRESGAGGPFTFEQDLAAITALTITALDVEDGLVVGGAPHDFVSQGRIAVFAQPACAGGAWTQTHELATIHKHQGDTVGLGASVAIDGGRVLATLDDYTFIGGPSIEAATVMRLESDCDGNGIADVCDIAGGADDLDGDGVLDACEGLGDRYCSPNVPNSTGSPAWLLANGSKTVGVQRFVLTMGGLPTDQFGLFLASRSTGFVMGPGGSQGNLCLGGSIARLRLPLHQWWDSGLDGRIHGVIDLANIPLSPPTPVLPGDTWYFQAWHRDGMTSNFTDGLSVTFE